MDSTSSGIEPLKLETTSKRMKPVSVEAADESNRRVVTKAPAAPWKTLASLISINLMPYRDSGCAVKTWVSLASDTIAIWQHLLSWPASTLLGKASGAKCQA